MSQITEHGDTLFETISSEVAASEMIMSPKLWYVESHKDVSIYSEALGIKGDDFGFPPERCENNRDAVIKATSKRKGLSQGVIDADNDAVDDSKSYECIFMTITRDWESSILASGVGKKVLGALLNEIGNVTLNKAQLTLLRRSLIEELSQIGAARMLNEREELKLNFKFLRQEREVQSRQSGPRPYLPCDPTMATIDDSNRVKLEMENVIGKLLSLQSREKETKFRRVFGDISGFCDEINKTLSVHSDRKARLVCGHDLIWLLRFILSVNSDRVLKESEVEDRFRTRTVGFLLRRDSCTVLDFAEGPPGRLVVKDPFWVDSEPTAY